MEVDYKKSNLQEVKELLEENGEHLEDLELDDQKILHLLDEGF